MNKKKNLTLSKWIALPIIIALIWVVVWFIENKKVSSRNSPPQKTKIHNVKSLLPAKPKGQKIQGNLKRQFFKELQKEKYAYLIFKDNNFAQRVKRQHMLESHLNKGQTIEVSILNLIKALKKEELLVTDKNRKKYLSEIDKSLKSKLDKMNYDELKQSCLDNGGRYQGQKTKKGWEYFTRNCLCTFENMSLSNYSWAKPPLYSLKCP